MAAATAWAIGDSRSTRAAGCRRGRARARARRMLTEREAEPSSPRGTEEVSVLEAESVEDRDGVPDPPPQLVGLRLVRLVAAALPAVIREDQARRSALGRDPTPSEPRADRRSPYREDGRARASRVLEVCANPIRAVGRI